MGNEKLLKYSLNVSNYNLKCRTKYLVICLLKGDAYHHFNVVKDFLFLYLLKLYYVIIIIGYFIKF